MTFIIPKKYLQNIFKISSKYLQKYSNDTALNVSFSMILVTIPLNDIPLTLSILMMSSENAGCVWKGRKTSLL